MMTSAQMEKGPKEENYPLLLLYVEENGKRSEYPHRVRFADKGRGKAVIKGAAAIITKWPAQVSSCWSTSIAVAGVFIFLSIMLLMSSLDPELSAVHARCTRNLNASHHNNTIHIVKDGHKWNHKQLELLNFIADTFPDFEIHNTVVVSSIKKREEPQTTEKSNEVAVGKLETESALKIIPLSQTNMFYITPNEANNYVSTNEPNPAINNYNIPPVEAIVVEPPPYNDYMPPPELNKNTIAQDLLQFEKEMIPADEFNLLNDSLFDAIIKIYRNNELNLLESTFDQPAFEEYSPNAHKRVKRHANNDLKYEDILETHSNLVQTETTLKKYFALTPLEYFWMDLTPEMIMFAVQIQELWQDGGITFYMPFENTIQNKLHPVIQPKMKDLRSMVKSVKELYEKLPEGLVNIDENGLFMVTKTPCHMVFGEILMKLQKYNDITTTSEFIHKILNTYCNKGAVVSDYCSQLKHKRM